MTDADVAIGKMIEGMYGLREGILELSKSMHCRKKHCPILTTGHDHYEVIGMLVGIGYLTWHCPFCGEEIIG